MALKIITDSTSYLDEKMILEYGINVLSLNVVMNSKSYREVDMDYHVFYKELAESTDFPKSSQPSLAEVETCFRRILEEGHDLLGIFISSKMSGTYQTAYMVSQNLREEFPNAKIQLVDSMSNCMELGFVVLEAAKKAAQGLSMESVIESCNTMIEKSNFIFLPETLEYLKRGGRIGKAKALLGNLLQLTPILTVANGETTVLQKVRTKKKAMAYIYQSFQEDIQEKGLGGAVIHHIENEEEAKSLAKKIEKDRNIHVAIQPIGPVIGCHVGPGAIGIVYYTEK